MKSALRNALRFGRTAAIAAVAVAALTPSAFADTVNVTNGSFESTTNGTGQLGFNTNVNGWNSNGGYTFVYAPGTADTTGAAGEFGNVQLWGANNGGLNTITTSPFGGNFLALDGAFNNFALTQTLTGLTVGNTVSVTFAYAGAQQSGFTGATTEGLNVSLGGQTDSTPILSDVSHGFTGWTTETLSFTATSSSELLSFVAEGTPSGVPPMTLLDGVSVAQTPEPASLALLSTGLIGLGGIVRRRFSKN